MAGMKSVILTKKWFEKQKKMVLEIYLGKAMISLDYVSVLIWNDVCLAGST